MNLSNRIFPNTIWRHHKGGLYRVVAIACGGEIATRLAFVGCFKVIDGAPNLTFNLFSYRSHGLQRYRYLGTAGRLHIFYTDLKTEACWARPLSDFVDRVSTAEGVVPRFVEVVACQNPD